MKDDLGGAATCSHWKDRPHRTAFALLTPSKNGGLNILSPDDRAGDYSRSVALSECLNEMEPLDAKNSQYKILRELKKQKLQNNITKIEKLEEVLTEGELYAMKLSSEKGASSWLNALPLQKYGFALTKSQFRGLGTPIWMGTEKSPYFVCMRWTFCYVARFTLCKRRIYSSAAQWNSRHIR